MSFEIAIIGGGASGLTCAIEAKRQSKIQDIMVNVTVFEHLSKPCKKLLATGNGRCNFCNTDLSPKHYHGDYDFITSVLSSEYNNTLEFFKDLGVLPYFENGRAYPRSEQATSIRDVLLKACDALSIKILTDTTVDFTVKNNKFLIFNKEYDALVIATGGNSQKAHGSDGSGYALLRKLGHKIIEPSPALSGLKVSEKDFKTLKGLRLKGNFSLYNGKKLLGEEYGEIQFTEQALSGIPVLNLSHLFQKNKTCYAVIDSCYEFTEKTLEKHFFDCRFKMPDLRIEDVLCGIVPQKIAYLVMKSNFANIKENTPVSRLTENNIKDLAYYLKHIQFKLDGIRDFDCSQVTQGGVTSTDFNSKTLMSKRQNGLFACGEILDVNGDCGGYNLHFAWTSGRLSGASCIKYLNNKG